DHPVLEVEAPAALFDHSQLLRTIDALVGKRREVFLAAGPTEAESPAAAELARDGFAPAPDAPPGRETWRGARVLTRLPAGRDPLRWVLLGRAFEGPGDGTEALWLAKPLGIDDELDEIARQLAGAGASLVPSAVTVNGHETAVASAPPVATPRLPSTDFSGSGPEGRRVVIGWACPVPRRAFFLRERITPADGRTDVAVAAELVRRFPCDHGPR